MSLTPQVAQAQEEESPAIFARGEPRPGTGDLAAKLCVIAPDLTEAHARRLAPIIEAAFTTYHVSSPAQQAMFLAQSAHETGGWHTFTERLPRAHAAEGDAYFDREYGGAHGRRLGNTEAHDGSSYRGRGALQITGRALYTDLARRTHLDLVNDPELAGEESTAFIVSAAYWNTRNSVPRHWYADHRAGEDFSWVPEELCGQSLNEVAQAGTGVAYDVITFAINPRLPAANVALRHAWYLRAATAFGVGGDASSRVGAPAASGGGRPPRHGRRGRGADPSDTTAEDAAVAAAPVQLDTGSPADDADNVHQLAEAGVSGIGGGLPHLASIQRSFGRFGVEDIVAHVGGPAAGAATGMGALAYATGDRVAFARSPDLHTAAHEAAHVVQQRAGVQLASGVGQSGDTYERHADAVADLVVRGESAEDLLAEQAGGTIATRGAVALARDPGHTGGDDCCCRGCSATVVQHRLAGDAAIERAAGVQRTAGPPRAAVTVQRTEGDSLAAIRLMSLPDLFMVFALGAATVDVHLSGGETVTFTQGWVSGQRGSAILRGEVRPRIQQEVHDDHAAALHTMIAGLTGAPGRVTELEAAVTRAESRTTGAAAGHRDERLTGDALVESGSQGRTMARRGQLLNTLPHRPGESQEHYDARVHATEQEVHSAMDVTAGNGTAIYAPVAGRVLWAGAGPRAQSGGYGNFVSILHDQPGAPHTEIAGDRLVRTHYCHLQEVLVATGDTVHPGQAIGLSGHTLASAGGSYGHIPRGQHGEPPTIGPHLHFSAQIVTGDGAPSAQVSSADEVSNAINPAIWLNELGVRLSDVGYETMRPTSRRGDEVIRGGLANPEGSDVAREPVQQHSDPARAVQRARVVQFIRPDNLVGMANFCGVTLSIDHGVNPALKTRLEAVHAHLQGQFDALPAEERTRLGSFQAYTGVQSIRGWSERRPRPGSRPATPSQHLTGSAVDVNYHAQPYIVTRTETAHGTVHGGESRSPVARPPVAAVYDRAVDFTRHGEDPAETADVGNRRVGESATAAYRRFRRTSDALRDYLSLAFHTDYGEVSRAPVSHPDTISEAELLAAIPTSERKDEATAMLEIQSYTTEQSWLTAHLEYFITSREMYIQMLRDYETVRAPMQYRDVQHPQGTRNPARGFLQLPEHFVVAMMDVGHLRWGACEFDPDANGDVHHYDLATPFHAPAPTGADHASGGP